MPQFPGGEDSLWSFIVKTIEFPHHLNTKEIVFVAFKIETSGEPTNIKIYKGENRLANEEVLRVFKKMPNWTPASCEGKAVAVQVVMPIVFAHGK